MVFWSSGIRKRSSPRRFVQVERVNRVPDPARRRAQLRSSDGLPPSDPREPAHAQSSIRPVARQSPRAVPRPRADRRSSRQPQHLPRRAPRPSAGRARPLCLVDAIDAARVPQPLFRAARGNQADRFRTPKDSVTDVAFVGAANRTDPPPRGVPPDLVPRTLLAWLPGRNGCDARFRHARQHLRVPKRRSPGWVSGNGLPKCHSVDRN